MRVATYRIRSLTGAPMTKITFSSLSTRPCRCLSPPRHPFRRILSRGACTEIALPKPATHASRRDVLTMQIKSLPEVAANRQNSYKGLFGVGSGWQLWTTYEHLCNHQAARQGRGRSGMQLAPCKCGLPFLAARPTSHLLARTCRSVKGQLQKLNRDLEN